MTYFVCLIISFLVVPCASLMCHILKLDDEDSKDVLFINCFSAFIIFMYGLLGMLQ